MDRRLTQEQVHEVVAYLEGSTCSLNELLQSEYGITEDDLTNADRLELDAHIMICESCGWWCAIDELNNESVCAECEEYA